MSYFVNKTDGSVIVVLDGTKDTTSTSLVLFGRLTTNYGDQTNENFVRLLENFSNSTSPANPISGQLWFDRNTNNIKAYTTDNAWVTVGSVIQGNVDISGNLALGPHNFAIKDLDGNVQITNNLTNGNVSIFSNVDGVSTRALHINSLTGLVEVSANAMSNFGVTTKLYVDSRIQATTSTGDTNLLANVAIINANLVARINTENDLRANIIAANAQIDLRDTISRVNAINLAINSALTSNVAAANARVNAANVNITDVNNRLDSVNLARDISLTANLSYKSNIASPAFTGTPTAPTASSGTNTTQIATTAFVTDAVTTLGGSIDFTPYATKASPTLTGAPLAPNVAASTNTSQIATTAFVHSVLPKGIILMWSGAVVNIPTGWALCDGANGTPNLRDRFIVGAGSTYSVAATGGSKDAVLVNHTHTASASSAFTGSALSGHSHDVTISPHNHSITDPGHRHTWGSGREGDDKGSGGSADEFTYAAGSNATVIQPAVTGIGINFTSTPASLTSVSAGTPSGTVATTVTVNNQGVSGTDANLPPYYALAFIMKTTGE